MYSIYTMRINTETFLEDPAVAGRSSLTNFKQTTRRPTESLAPLSDSPQLKMADGWIVDEDGNLLIWVPDEYRASLWSPGMLVLVGRDPIDISFENVYHGIDWARCITL